MLGVILAGIIMSLGSKIVAALGWAGLIAIIAVIVVLVLLWHIPFVHNFFINLYEENAIIHTAIDLISNIFK